MAKLVLKANPTFVKKVGIPVAGGETADVTFTFRHRTKTGLQEFIAERPDKSDAETVLDMAEGWDLEEEFNETNVTEMLENYAGSALAIYHAYINELLAAKVKN